MKFEVIPTVTGIGAEIRGVDLSQAIDDALFGRIRDLLHEYTVIFFRGQKLSEQQHVDFAKRLGPLRPPIPGQDADVLVPGFPDLTRLSNIIEDGKPIGLVDAGQYWHSDGCYRTKPNGYAVLYAVEIPRDDCGRALGDTMFASLKNAYRDLPNEVKQLVKDRKAVHYYQNPQRAKDAEFLRLAQVFKAPSADLPPVAHPIVRTHPYTGEKGLYVNPQYTWSIEGMDEDEGRKLINLLTSFITREGVVYRHSWQEGDFLIWDDCSLQHRAVGDYRLPQRRLLTRTTVAGTAPF
jgi:taurine dioxygenase